MSGVSDMRANTDSQLSTMPATHYWAFVLICLLSFSAAAPAGDDCSQLNQPLTANELHQILGRWIFIEGLVNDESFYASLRYVESMWMVLKAAADNGTVHIEIANRLLELPQPMPNVSRTEDAPIPTTICETHHSSNPGPQPVNSMQFMKDRCFWTPQNMTVVDGRDLELYLKVADSYYRFLQTCPYCLLMHVYNKVNSYQMFYLFGRNETVAASDLETFWKQAECLQFPLSPKFHYDPNNELCPEREKTSDSTLQHSIY